MKKTKIDWPFENLHTWNPVTGCLHGCSYCYARRMANRFVGHFNPTFHDNRLQEPGKIKKPVTIFVCSMADLFGPWVSDSWIYPVLKSCQTHSRHRYLFLTQNPERYLKYTRELSAIKNCWLGVTAKSGQEVKKFGAMALMKRSGFKTFLSAEPLLGYFKWVDLEYIFDQVIVGPMTGPRAIPPKKEWLDSIKHSRIYKKACLNQAIKNAKGR